MSSKLISSISLIGSMLPSTWMISLFSKHLTTWTIASTLRMLPKNWLPKPSPLEAPLTSPAISVNSKVALTCFFGWNKEQRTSKRGSLTSTTPTFGEIVAKG